MPHSLQVLSTTRTGDDQSPQSAGGQTDLIFTPTNLEPSSSPLVIQKVAIAKRLFITIWFAVVTVAISGAACAAAVAIKAYYRAQVILKRRSRLEAELREETVRGYVVDYAVWNVMRCCRSFCPVQIVGPRPSFTLSNEQFAQHMEANAHACGSDSSLRILPLPRNVENGNVLVPPRCIVLSNHMSNIDGFSIKSALFPSASKAIIKAALTKVPIVGWLVSLSKEPLVHFTRSRGGWGTDKKNELLTRCAEVLDRNYPLVVFPEGVRRLFGRMAPFRHGMLKFAIENEYPLYVAAIHGSERVWPVHSALMYPGEINVAFSDKLLLPSKTTDVVALCDVIREEMVTLLKGFPRYDAEAERPITDISEYKRLEQAARRKQPESSKSD